MTDAAFSSAVPDSNDKNLFRVCFAPGQLLPGLCFYYFDDQPERRPLLERILKFVCLTGCCRGPCNSWPEVLDKAQHDDVIVTAPVSFPELKTLPPDVQRHLIIMPLPIGDIWCYWEIFGHTPMLLDCPETAARACVSGENFLRFLCAYRPSNFYTDASGRISRNPKLYYNDFTDLLTSNTAAIDLIYNHFSDNHSKDTFQKLLFGKPSNLWEYHFAAIFHKMQYFDYITVSNEAVILNGGLHTGNEVPFFLAALGGEGQIHNVDPMGNGFLNKYAAAFIDHNPGITFQHTLALDDHDGEVALPVNDSSNQALGQFSSTGKEGCRTINFPCLSIDSLVEKLQLSRLDLIKLDLEGAEIRVIKQMAATVQKYRPQLAVSVYHLVIDILAIPLYLMQNLKDYHFYLEHYSFETYETILYCIPEERLRPAARKIALQLT